MSESPPPLTPRTNPAGTARRTSSAPAPARRTQLERRLRLIVAATITYNVVEAIIAITAGRLASSAALIGFGLDSTVEVLSAAAVAWQFAAADPRRRERTAMRLIALSFFGLALVVGVDAVRTLLGAADPEHSTVGIVLAALSLAIMPLLSWLERRTGREMGSASAVADSKQTLICSYLSAVLLVGLVLNSTLGWSWADPLAALVIAVVALREGVEAWRGDACCTPLGAMLEHDDGAKDDGPGEAGCEGGCCGPPAPRGRRG
ncbi:cation diffusion facilitator family transporter [Nesterenkonia sp. F]|uniref:cation diffusion facilitator family transporter n=1 Tax=Nesterenkonia sp. F TaxID=795955 RepID=UPI000A011193|nr:cation transporter [Nesterenkonia sp. F]